MTPPSTIHYDPRLFNDRLLLGLRGTISEVELHCIQERLHGARMSKARRGEFPLGLPVGYVRDREGRIEVDPDEAVQGAIRTIFAQFDVVGKASGVEAGNGGVIAQSLEGGVDFLLRNLRIGQLDRNVLVIGQLEFRRRDDRRLARLAYPHGSGAEEIRFR